jgi:pimeloyl-ACP methyl ester carboxylesterase
MFVHGAGENLDQFKHQHAYFSKTYKVVSVSLRGHDQSSLTKKINLEAFSLEKYWEGVS